MRESHRSPEFIRELQVHARSWLGSEIHESSRIHQVFTSGHSISDSNVPIALSPGEIQTFSHVALLPMLSLGIPGSPTAAVLLGGLLIWGLQPGPLLCHQRRPCCV